MNIKAVRLPGERPEQRARISSRPFEIWKETDRLTQVLRDVYAEIRPRTAPEGMAVTMSAELSDVFNTKREGVLFVVESIRECFPNFKIYFLNVSGNFHASQKALEKPLEYAAANWVASALWIARKNPNGLLIDIGSTTTDIIPILNGEICVPDRTDTARLTSGTLVYTGVLRTNLAAIVPSVPVAGRACRVASEYFTVSGDVHLILGHIRPEDFTCPTPDNRPPTPDSARNRLARLVCADSEMLSMSEIDALALYIHEQQVLQIRSGLEQVVAALPELRSHPVSVHGTGAFLGREAAQSLEMTVHDAQVDVSPQESAVLPAFAVASLLSEKLGGER